MGKGRVAISNGIECVSRWVRRAKRLVQEEMIRDEKQEETEAKLVMIMAAASWEPTTQGLEV